MSAQVVGCLEKASNALSGCRIDSQILGRHGLAPAGGSRTLRTRATGAWCTAGCGWSCQTLKQSARVGTRAGETSKVETAESRGTTLLRQQKTGEEICCFRVSGAPHQGPGSAGTCGSKEGLVPQTEHRGRLNREQPLAQEEPHRRWDATAGSAAVEVLGF